MILGGDDPNILQSVNIHQIGIMIYFNFLNNYSKKYNIKFIKWIEIEIEIKSN